MYQIKVTPANTSFPPHIWKEGGTMSKERAEYYANQLRATPDYIQPHRRLYSGKLYSSVEVVKVNQ